MTIKCQPRRKIMLRRRWVLASPYSQKKPQARLSLTVNQPVKQMISKTYSNRQQIYLETKNWSIQDHKLVHISLPQKKEPMSKLKSSSVAILYLTQFYRATTSKLKGKEQMCSKKSMEAQVCQMLCLAVTITMS